MHVSLHIHVSPHTHTHSQEDAPLEAPPTDAELKTAIQQRPTEGEGEKTSTDGPPGNTTNLYSRQVYTFIHAFTF